MRKQDEEYKKQLITRYVSGEASEKELQAFFGLLSQQQLEELISAHMDLEIDALQQEYAQPVRRSRLWPRIAVAATVAAAVLTGAYFAVHQSNQPQAVATVKPGTFKNDARPGNKAILTLGNGQQLTVTSLPTGRVAHTNVQKTAGGQLVYDNSAPNAVEYNTLTVPRGGGKHELRLADGTLAVLDAGSSIRFPVAFPGKDRNVSITGQVYFEVVHNAQKPFYVHVGNQTIADIGTAFNVNAFDGEVRTTLLEGSVMVDKLLLKPGQQAWHREQATTLITEVDRDAVIAWKNDLFKFSGDASIQTVMNQLSRWYDMDIVYEGKGKNVYHFGGDMPRYAKLSDVLKILTFSGVQFAVDGRKIIVYQ